MTALLTFCSYAAAAAALAAVLMLRTGAGVRQPGNRLVLAAFAVTTCWAWLSAVAPGDPLIGFAESARNLVWIGLLYSLSAAADECQRGVRLVYGAVAAVVGMQLVADTVMLLTDSAAVVQASLLLRITTAAGALVLVHNLYGQAAPA